MCGHEDRTRNISYNDDNVLSNNFEISCLIHNNILLDHILMCATVVVVVYNINQFK